MSLVEGRDYYREGELVVFTEDYLRRRGYCCESGCRHCPYTPKGGAGAPEAEEGNGGEAAVDLGKPKPPHGDAK